MDGRKLTVEIAPPRDRLAEIERALAPLASRSPDGGPLNLLPSEVAAASAILATLAEMRADMEGLAELSARATPGPIITYSGVPSQGPYKTFIESTADKANGGQIIAEFQGPDRAWNAAMIARSVNIIRKWLGSAA